MLCQAKLGVPPSLKRQIYGSQLRAAKAVTPVCLARRRHCKAYRYRRRRAEISAQKHGGAVVRSSFRGLASGRPAAWRAAAPPRGSSRLSAGGISSSDGL